MRHLNLLLLLTLLGNIALAGGPWTPAKGKGLIIANVTPIYYTTVTLAKNSHLKTNRAMLEITSQIYGEYGINNNLAITTNIPLRYVSSSETLREGDFTDTLPAGNLFDFGNISLALKYKFYDGKWVAAGSFRMDANTSSSRESTGLRTGYDTWGFYPALHVGKSFTERMYIQFEGYAGFRLNKYSHEWGLMAEYGGRLKKPIWIAILLQWRGSFKNGTRTNDNGDQTGLYNNDQEYLAYTLKFSWEASYHFGLNWSMGGAIWTAYIARGPSLSFGAFYQW